MRPRPRPAALGATELADGVVSGTAPESGTFSRALISPMMPRRKASTQTTKIAPCVTVTQEPNWAR